MGKSMDLVEEELCCIMGKEGKEVKGEVKIERAADFNEKTVEEVRI